MLGLLQPKPTTQCQDNQVLVRGPVKLGERQRVPVVCNAIWLKSVGGVKTRHSTPFGIAIDELVKSQSLEGLCRGSTSVSWPSPLPSESPGKPWGIDVDRPGLPPSSDQLFLLGWAWQTSSPPTCPGSLRPQHLHNPSQPRTLAGACGSEPVIPPFPWGHKYLSQWPQWPCCSLLVHSLAWLGRGSGVPMGAVRGTSKGEDKE